MINNTDSITTHKLYIEKVFLKNQSLKKKKKNWKKKQKFKL